ncbi:MAG: type II secretion system secretin GspD [Gammaproteobacteria bacterium]
MNKLVSIVRDMLVASLLGLLLMSEAVYAQEVTLNFSDADLISVINSVSQITGKNFIIDPRVKGKVTVISSKPLNVDEVYSVFLSILQVHGFATVPTKNAIKIIPDATAKQNAAPLTQGKNGPGDQLITRVLQIKYINAAQLVPILRPLVAQQGHLAAYATTNVLIISDRASNIERIERIIRQMDRKNDADIEIIKLNYAFAAEVVRLLSSLSLSAADQKNPLSGQVKFTADERTNSILLSGEKSKRLKYQAIIAALDEPVETTGNTHVVYLRYAEAKNLATILGKVGAEVIKSEAKNSPVPKTGVSTESFSIQADETTNALIITSPASVFLSLRSVIQQLDIPRAQVHIEAIIAEVALDTSNELGVEWLFDASATGDPVLATQFDGSITSVASGILPDGLTLGLGRLDDPKLNFVTLIRALAGDSETNLLSTPSIVTLDNQEAEIIVGQNVPFVTGETSNTITTGAITNPFRTIERRDIGISLKVKPQINEGNTITLEIQQEVSNISGSATGAVDIVTNKRSIKTTVQLQDGELLILGGLIDDKVVESVQKIPGLGDIPILGALFRSTKLTKVKQNLVVFIRATIIKDPVKARALSRRKYNFMRDLQLQNYDEEDPITPVLDPFE